VRCRYEDDLAEKGIKLARGDDDYRTPEMAALVDANIAARLALAETTPTTMAGLLAVLQFVREQSQDDFLFDGDEGKTTSFSMATKRAHALSPRSSMPCLECCRTAKLTARRAGGRSARHRAALLSGTRPTARALDS
jgi:hypothetical protein